MVLDVQAAKKVMPGCAINRARAVTKASDLFVGLTIPRAGLPVVWDQPKVPHTVLWLSSTRCTLWESWL